jgi:hypothetical protein
VVQEGRAVEVEAPVSAALADGAPITVACTQEAALFTELAEDAGATAPLTFVNIRETGGWSKDAAAA